MAVRVKIRDRPSGFHHHAFPFQITPSELPDPDPSAWRQLPLRCKMAWFDCAYQAVGRERNSEAGAHIVLLPAAQRR